MTSAGGHHGLLSFLAHGDGLELEYPIRLVEPTNWLGHTPFAFWLVGALRPRRLVELGGAHWEFLLLLHDTAVRERGFGIWRLWEEIAARYPGFELPHSCGLGIAYVGSEPLSGALEALFGAKTDDEVEGTRR